MVKNKKGGRNHRKMASKHTQPTHTHTHSFCERRRRNVCKSC